MRIFVLMVLVAMQAQAANWPAFLGAGAEPDSVDVEKLPIKWSSNENIAWRADLSGYGQSSPVVFSGRVFLTCVEGDMKEKCTIMAINLSDGNEAWKRSIDSSEKVKSSNYVSRAAPTPVVDSERVLCFFESGDLVALNHDGQILWHRSLSKEFGKIENRFCIAASPAQDENAVYLLVDHDGPSYLLAIDKSNGKDIWKQDRSSRTSWSSPALLPINGKPQIVVSSAGTVDGYDPSTGELIWTKDDVGGNTAATPTLAGESLVLIGASPGSRGESTAIAAKSNLLLRISDQDGKVQVSEQWKAGKAMSSFGSPIMFEGMAYWVNRAGVVFCFDLKTGQQQFSERLAESCWATPLGIGNRIYFFGRTGKTTVIQSGPEFKKLATNTLWDAEEDEPSGNQPRFGGPTQYGVAAVGDSLLIRTGSRLFCVRKVE